jgi:GntR family transcriptional regulator, trigonelline degradation regulator
MADNPTVSVAPLGGVARFAAPLRQQVVDELRNSIVDGRYAPGSRLIERVLCEEMQVSRTVVREALRQLESEHLISMVPNIGPIVRHLTKDEVRGLYEVRAVLESLAAGACAARVTPEIVARLDGALELIESLSDDDIPGLLRGKDAFIHILIDGSGNAVIGEMLASIHARVSQLRAVTLQSPGRLRITVGELHQVRNAVAEGDTEGASTAARRHVESAGKIALSTFDRD